MRLSPLEKKLVCVVAGAEVDGSTLRVRFAPVSGHAGEIEDLIPLGPRGSMACVRGIGRVLRILRAGRIRIPNDPYTLGDDPERAATLVLRCQGSSVALTLGRRIERMLTVWTDSGVEQIHGVIDYVEDSEGLSVRRKGGQSTLAIPRHSLIRFAPSSNEYFEVISVDIPAGSRLR